MAKKYVMALDAGTTSNRAIILNFWILLRFHHPVKNA